MYYLAEECNGCEIMHTPWRFFNLPTYKLAAGSWVLVLDTLQVTSSVGFIFPEHHASLFDDILLSYRHRRKMTYYGGKSTVSMHLLLHTIRTSSRALGVEGGCAPLHPFFSEVTVTPCGIIYLVLSYFPAFKSLNGLRLDYSTSALYHIICTHFFLLFVRGPRFRA